MEHQRRVFKLKEGTKKEEEGRQSGSLSFVVTFRDAWCALPKKIAREENAEVACDHFHRWKEDISLLQELGVNVYRFSLSWSRIMPDGREINELGIKFYSDLIDELLRVGKLLF